MTARCEPLIILAASSIDSRLPGPNEGVEEPVKASQSAAPSITSFGRLTNAAPGRSDSAATNALANTSPMDCGEVASTLYFVRGRTLLHLERSDEPA